jgi:PAS domain S-box-containing protein
VRIRETAVVEAGQQRELLATTLASIGDAVIATDANGGVVFLNPTAETLTGWKNFEAAGKLLPEVFHILNEHTRQPVENPVEKALRLGTVVGLANHAVLLAKDGREIPIDDSAAPIRQADGQILGVVLVFRDATLQRKAHEASARLAAIVEHSGDAIFTKNLDGIVQTWNASAQRLFGYRAEEIVGQHVTLLFPPDRLNEEDDILGRLRQGRPIERLETVRVAKDGKRIPVSVSVSPLRDKDGKIIGASKIIHDVTDLVAAREALVREKELLATTLASIGDAVIVTNAEGRITFLNTEAERLTKWKNAEASGQQLPKVFTIINEQSRATVEDPVEKVLRLGLVVGLANHTTLIAKDGTEIPIDDSAAPIRQADGPLFGVVLVFRDVREQRKAQAALHAREEALRQAHAQLANHATELESLVQQRTARLNEMIGDLEAFSYSIVHDLRGPLRAMQGFAQLLADEYDPIGGAARNYVGRIQTAAERMDRLIQDGLSYSRIMRADLALVPVDVAALLRGIVHTYPAFQPPHAEIELQENIPSVNGNESALTQCVSNLLGNAVKFVARGVTPRVRIWAETRNGRVRLFFKDNGIGIEMEAHEKIFRIFERLDRAYEGTGIGLAIVKKAAERMGGSVGVESAPGQGSIFWLDLAGADHGPGATEQARTTRGHL